MYIIWLILSFLFVMLELGHPGLFMFLSISLGFLGVFFISLLGFSFKHQLFLLFVFIFIFYQILKLRLKKLQPEELKTNVDALIGKKVQILKREGAVGQVKIAGEVWSATFEDGLSESGDFEVKSVKGCRLIIGKRNLR